VAGQRERMGTFKAYGARIAAHRYTLSYVLPAGYRRVMNLPSFESYVVSGRFLADAEQLKFEGYPKPRDESASAQMPSSDFVQRLPAAAQASLTALHEMVRSGKVPAIYRFNTNLGWGFDFKANDVEVLNAAFEGDLSGDVFSLATDGGGNHFCLQANGKVVVWNHEENNIEDHTQFESLDEALWCILHREAISDDNLSYEEVKEVFAAKAGGAENGWSFFRDEIEEA